MLQTACQSLLTCYDSNDPLGSARLGNNTCSKSNIKVNAVFLNLSFGCGKNEAVRGNI